MMICAHAKMKDKLYSSIGNGFILYICEKTPLICKDTPRISFSFRDFFVVFLICITQNINAVTIVYIPFHNLIDKEWHLLLQ